MLTGGLLVGIKGPCFIKGALLLGEEAIAEITLPAAIRMAVARGAASLKVIANREILPQRGVGSLAEVMPLAADFPAPPAAFAPVAQQDRATVS